MKKGYQQFIYGLLGDKPIIIYPCMVKMLGGRSVAIFFNQMLYWTDKGRDPEWIYKTIQEAEEETTLTRKAQDRAIKKLKALGLLETKLKGVPPKRYFKINNEKLLELIDNYQD